MAIDYQPLLDIMGKKKISWYRLEKLGIDNRTVHQLRHNLNITTGTIGKLCKILECQPGDILRYLSLIHI